MPVELQAFLEGLSVWTVVVWLVVIAAAFPILRKLWRLFKQLADFLDDVMGEPARAGVPARPGLMERVGKVEENQKAHGKAIDTVRHELFPNSGKSLRDQTNRMEQKLDADNTRIGELSDRLDEHIEQSQVILNRLEKK